MPTDEEEAALKQAFFAIFDDLVRHGQANPIDREWMWQCFLLDKEKGFPSLFGVPEMQ